MPLSGDIDRDKIVIAGLSGAIAAFFHWAAVQTSEREVPKRVLRGQMIASFASGMVVTWAMSIQTLITVDPLGVFCAAAVVGFVYGPSGLAIAARAAERKANLENPANRELESRMRVIGRDEPQGPPVVTPVVTAAVPAPAAPAAEETAPAFDLEALR